MSQRDLFPTKVVTHYSQVDIKRSATHSVFTWHLQIRSERRMWMSLDQPTIQFGDSGEAVTRLQEDLSVVRCFSDVADGFFNQSTTDAVIQFQESVGLSPDGVVGSETWTTLEGPEVTVENSIDLAEFPGVSLAFSRGSNEDVDGYLADLGIGLV